MQYIYIRVNGCFQYFDSCFSSINKEPCSIGICSVASCK